MPSLSDYLEPFINIIVDTVVTFQHVVVYWRPSEQMLASPCVQVSFGFAYVGSVRISRTGELVNDHCTQRLRQLAVE